MRTIILTICCILFCSLINIYGQNNVETVQSNKKIPFKNIKVDKDTIGGMVEISFPKDWVRDPSMESSPSHHYRCLKRDNKIIAFFDISIMYMDHINVNEIAHSTNRDYTGTNGHVVNTLVDGREAAYCFYVQTSPYNPENNFSLKHLFINVDNKALVTFKTTIPKDQTNWNYKDILDDIEDSIKIINSH